MEWRSQLRGLIRGIGIAMLAIGLSCMPAPLVNPEAFASLFPALAAAGMLVRFGIITTTLGAVLFGISFIIPSA